MNANSRTLWLIVSAGVALMSGCSKVVTWLAEPLMTSELSAAEKKKVEIVYAVIPRSALPIAVTGIDAALNEEAKMASSPGERRFITDYVTVIFATNHSRFSPLFGTMRIWMPNGPIDVNADNVSNAPPSIFVMGAGGGGCLAEYWKNAKKSEWVTLRVRN